MPILDHKAAAESLGTFLRLLTTAGRLRLRYRITAGAGAADPHGLEAREIYVELSGPDTPLLMDRSGELLRALEHMGAKLLRLESDEHDKISFDADNYKALRAQELLLRAETAVETVARTGQPFVFAPGNSRERRLLHLALRGFRAIESESVGEGRQRVLVVFPSGYDRATYTPPSLPARPDRLEGRHQDRIEDRRNDRSAASRRSGPRREQPR